MASHGPRRSSGNSEAGGLLEAVLEHYGVELRSGSRWGEQAALCPVHGERRPSLRINLEKGVMFCQACQFKGTAINLIMAMESCTRAEAQERAEKLARAAGVTITASPGRYRRPGQEQAQAARTRYVPPGRR